VYDGRLVIDASFHTNDVSIHAAGPMTKYQRRYYSELTHADFNSKEIGVQVSAVDVVTVTSMILTLSAVLWSRPTVPRPRPRP